MKRKWIILFLIIWANWGYCQDITFSQFYAQPVLRNPALAGVFDGDVRVSGIFRNQWQSVTVPFQTTSLSTEYKLPFNKFNDWLTIGMEMSNDVAGDIKLQNTQLLPFLNFHKSLNDNAEQYLSVAFMGGPVYSQFDPTKLQLDDQFVNGAFNPNNPTQQVFTRTGFTYWDASTGVSFSSVFNENDHFYIGVGVFHFNHPRVAFYTGDKASILNTKIALNAGVTLNTSETNKLIFYADYFRQGQNEQFLGGATYNTEISRRYSDNKTVSFDMGAYYRWNDAFIPTLKLDMYDWSGGVSYDINVSGLKTASQWRGGFEFSLTYRSKLNSRSALENKVLCPTF